MYRGVTPSLPIKMFVFRFNVMTFTELTSLVSQPVTFNVKR